jgi:hypothetical protein
MPDLLVLEKAEIQKFIPRRFVGGTYYRTMQTPTGRELFIIGSLIGVHSDVVESVFDQLTEKFFAEYPAPLQSTAMEERVAAVNLECGAILEQLLGDRIAFDCVLVEINSNTLSVACVGNAVALLFHHKEISTLDAGEEKIDLKKLFPSFLTGEINEGDKIVITSKAIFNIVSTDQLAAIVFKYDPLQARRRIAAIVEATLPPDESFFALLLGLKKAPNLPTTSRHGLIESLSSYLTTLYKRLKTIDLTFPSLYDKLKTLKQKAFQYPENDTPNFRRRRHFLGLIALSLLVLGTTAILVSHSAKTKHQTAVDAASLYELEPIEEQLSQAQAAIIYKNKAQAQQALTEAEKALGKTYDNQGKNLEQTTRWQALHRKWQELEDELSALTK